MPSRTLSPRTSTTVMMIFPPMTIRSSRFRESTNIWGILCNQEGLGLRPEVPELHNNFSEQHPMPRTQASRSELSSPRASIQGKVHAGGIVAASVRFRKG